MFEKKIEFRDTEELREFVKAAERCDFDINVIYGNTCIDAKSLLGMIYLGFCKVLTIQYGHKDVCFENAISKYAVA